MNPSGSAPFTSTRLSNPHRLSRDSVFMLGDLLPLLDFTSVCLAAWLAAVVYSSWLAPQAGLPELWDNMRRVALAGAVLAPLLLCERAYVAFASNGQIATLIRCYGVRFLMFTGIVAALGLSSAALASLPRSWLLVWFVATLALTAATRGALVAGLRRLERQGALRETIAVVGTGEVADQLVRRLRQMRGDCVEILGPYQGGACALDAAPSTSGAPVEELLELGKSRRLDWILLALTRPSPVEVSALVLRLKALSAPIAQCAQDIGTAPMFPPQPGTGTLLGAVGLSGRRASSWDQALAAAAPVLPPWIITLLQLPLSVLRFARRALRRRQRPAAAPVLHLTLDDYDLPQFLAVASDFGAQRYGYVVTPNADHLLRLHREAEFRALYADAAYVLLDSRFVARRVQAQRGIHLPVCTGSDLTARLFDSVITPLDRLVLIGGSAAQAQTLAQRHGLRALQHFNPPMGFIRDPAEVERCLQFIEAHSPFRYCLLAIGSPQQEVIARQLKRRGQARGLALCIGASINFLTGEERRAPAWMQRQGLEWLFRLLQAPRRLAHRYLAGALPLLRLLRHTEVELRAAGRHPALVTALPRAASSNVTWLPERRKLVSPTYWPRTHPKRSGAWAR